MKALRRFTVRTHLPERLAALGRLSIDTPIPPNITGMYVVDSLLAGQFATTADALRHLILPSVCLAITVVVPVGRIVRSSMLNALNQDYVRTARAKGLLQRQIVFTHAFRNALLPVVTAIGLVYGLLLGGAVLAAVTVAEMSKSVFRLMRFSSRQSVGGEASSASSSRAVAR